MKPSFVYFYTMTPVRKLEIDLELRGFLLKTFEKPASCRNAGQVRYYSSEWRDKIAEYEARYNFVPAWAYTVLDEYFARENLLLENNHPNSH